jgi:peptide chain release factor 3
VLAPEHFRTVHNRDSGRYKQCRRGLAQLEQEGVIHLLRRQHAGDPVPIIAGVGPMQFEVAAERLGGEFGVHVRLDHLDWGVARRTDEDGARTILSRAREAEVLLRTDGTPLALFRNEFMLQRFAEQHPDVMLDPFVIREELA